MIKRALLFAMAGMIFVGAESYAQSTPEKKACSTTEKSGCCSKDKKNATLTEVKAVTKDELTALIDNKNVTVFDARDEKSFEDGHITGAVLFAADNLPADKNATLVFYCGGLKCPAASRAAKQAVEKGYKNVMVFRGGWSEWKNS